MTDPVGRCSIVNSEQNLVNLVKERPLSSRQHKTDRRKKIPYSFNLWVSLRREIALEFGLKQDKARWSLKGGGAIVPPRFLRIISETWPV